MPHRTVQVSIAGYQDHYCQDCEEYTRCSDEDDPQCASCGRCLCESYIAEREAELEAADEAEDEYQDDASQENERNASAVAATPSAVRPSVSPLFLPALPGRPIRPMSFEQEIASGRNSVARALYHAGYAPSADVWGYSSSGEVWRNHHSRGTFVHVENDGSCGGEIIYSRLNLADDSQASAFVSAFNVAKSEVRLDMHCGFHIHVDARGFGMRGIENLYHAHNYLEDVLYRLGSANWSAHRTEVNETDYAPVMQKGLTSKGSIGSYLEGSRGALNFSNYLASRGRCTCGAFAFADWESCSCDLPKATVEFRWPNATANLTKVHAYASLLQALVARCATAQDREFADLPAMGFTHSSDSHEDAWVDRFEWIGRNLVLARNELQSLAYCAERSHFHDSGAALAYAIASAKPASHELVSI